jgi:hypothetical protein
LSDLVTAGGNITLNAAGAILDEGGNDLDLNAGGTASLTAVLGIGQTGSGSIDVQTVNVALTNTGAGSVYVAATQSVNLTGGALQGAGYLYLTVAGDLSVETAFDVADGSAHLRVTGAVTVATGAGVAVSRDLVVRASSMTLVGTAELASSGGDLLVQVQTDVVMDAGSTLGAAAGDVRLQAGGALTHGVVTAADAVTLRVGGSMAPAGVGALVTGAAVQLIAGGDINGVVTQAGRMDLQAGGVAQVFEADDLEIGRFGLQLVDAQVDDELELNMAASGSLSSVHGTTTVPGAGSLVWQSPADVTLDTVLIVPDGDVRIDANSLAQGAGVAGDALQVPQGDIDVSLVTGTQTTMTAQADLFAADSVTGALTFAFSDGVTVRAAVTGASGSVDLTVGGGDLVLNGTVAAPDAVSLTVTDDALVANVASLPAAVLNSQGAVSITAAQGVVVNGAERLGVAAGSFSAAADSGNLRINFTQAVAMGSAGVMLSGGDGEVDLRVASGDLTMNNNAAIRNLGGGDVTINVASGAFLMGATNSVRVATGAMDIRVLNNFVVGLLESYGSSTYLQSINGSISRQAIGGNLLLSAYGDHIPTINHGGTIDLWVRASLAVVNGSLRGIVSGSEFMQLT